MLETFINLAATASLHCRLARSEGPVPSSGYVLLLFRAYQLAMVLLAKLTIGNQLAKVLSFAPMSTLDRTDVQRAPASLPLSLLTTRVTRSSSSMGTTGKVVHLRSARIVSLATSPLVAASAALEEASAEASAAVVALHLVLVVASAAASEAVEALLAAMAVLQVAVATMLAQPRRPLLTHSPIMPRLELRETR